MHIVPFQSPAGLADGLEHESALAEIGLRPGVDHTIAIDAVGFPAPRDSAD
jgi:hypothetical protein